MRWGIRKERETRTFYRPKSCLLSWVARLLWLKNKQTNKQTKTMIFTNCPVKAQSEAIVEKIHFSSPCHWNRKFLHLGILKIVYLITKLQNTGDFGYVVSVNLSFGKYLWELFSLSERQWGTKDVITMLLTSFHFIHQCWLNT